MKYLKVIYTRLNFDQCVEIENINALLLQIAVLFTAEGHLLNVLIENTFLILFIFCCILKYLILFNSQSTVSL